MGEFDLDLQFGGTAFGWESVFRPQPGGVPGIVRMDTGSDCCVYACDPTSNGGYTTCSGHTDCGTCVTCGPGATGSPCAC
jgi:hypothetical protein